MASRWWWNPGAGDRALLPDALYTEAGAIIGDAWAAERRQGGAAVDRGGGPAAQRADPDRIAGSTQRRQPDRRVAGRRGARVRGRGDPADLARPGDGCVVVAGQRGRVQGGAAGGVGVDAVLPDADHRGGHGETGHRAGARGRGWRVCRRWRRPSGWAADTTGYDVRPEVADQVRSVGAQWLDLGIRPPARAGTRGSSPRRSAPQQQKALEEAITKFDVVITTALVPGRPAPRLVTAAAVRGDEARQRGGRPGR